MTLNREVSDFSISFKAASIYKKIFLIIGFFFTVSSLASLSNTIFQWKGFILDGISFYKQYVVSPFSIAAKSIGMNYSEIEIHVATATSISITAGIKILVTGQKAVYRTINEKYDTDLKPSLTMFWLLAIIGPIGIWVWYGLTDPTIRIWYVTAVVLIYPIFIVAPKTLMSKNDHESIKENYLNYFKGYYAYIGLFIIVIGVLAAINSGLKEENPNDSISHDTVTEVLS